MMMKIKAKANSGESHNNINSSSPRLLRSRSGSTAGTSATYALMNTSSITSLNRSKSTTKSKTRKAHDREEKLLPSTDGYQFLQPTNQSKKKNIDRQVPSRRSRSANTSPSAWALSPGRPPALPLPIIFTAASSTSKRSATGGVISGAVLKYFRQKKVSPLKQEEYHQLRIMHNSLLQWRFANARTQLSFAAANKVAQKKLFNVWLRISMMRNFLVEKQIQMQKLTLEIKLHHILMGQVYLLKEWGRMGSKSGEAIGRLIRKLSASSVSLPLAQGAKADPIAFLDAMEIARRVMESIETTIEDFQSQAEKVCYLMTELSVVLKEQNECASKLLQEHLRVVTLLEEEERRLRVQHIQLVKASRIDE